MKRKNTLKEILQRYLSGNASAEESKRVDRFYQDLESDLDISTKRSPDELREIESRILNNIKIQQTDQKVRKLRRIYWRAAAAILLPLLLVGGYYWGSNNNAELDLSTIGPGKLHANLITADGQVYSLSSLTDLKQLKDQGLQLEQLDPAAAMHKIITPKGGYYQLLLPDSTSVWLNAATTIRFPSRFSKDKREVYLEGEAYFDVTHDAKAPFIVHTGLQTTKVLGTKFNIASYRGQQTDIVTLVEGSVEASSRRNEKIRLTPGHQARIGDRISYAAIDNAADVSAWRNGEFYFDNTPIAEVMMMIGRWYNVEVDLNNLPPNKLTGLISRNVPLNQLLDLIETTSNVKIIARNGKLSTVNHQKK